MSAKTLFLGLVAAAAIASVPLAAQAQGTSTEVHRERCFVAMLQAWCPGIASSTSDDTKRCVKKHWPEMGGYCQNAYRMFKP